MSWPNVIQISLLLLLKKYAFYIHFSCRYQLLTGSARPLISWPPVLIHHNDWVALKSLTGSSWREKLQSASQFKGKWSLNSAFQNSSVQGAYLFFLSQTSRNNHKWLPDTILRSGCSCFCIIWLMSNYRHLRKRAVTQVLVERLRGRLP